MADAGCNHLHTDYEQEPVLLFFKVQWVNIAEYFLTVGEKEQEEILMEWNEFLASVESVGKEYKSIFAQISTDILRNKFSESEV